MTHGNHGNWIALGQGKPICVCVLCVFVQPRVDAPSCSADLLNKVMVKPCPDVCLTKCYHGSVQSVS